MTWSPCNWVRSRVRSRSGIPVPPAAPGRDGTRPRGRACASGSRRPGAPFPASPIIGRSRPSPRSSPRTPETQPRQLSWATTTVISAITRPSAPMNRSRYWRVSWLRRSMKLRSCSSTSLAIGPVLAVDRVHADVNRPAGETKTRLGQLGGALRLPALERAREAGTASQHGSVERAQADGEQALVLDRAIEQRLQARLPWRRRARRRSSRTRCWSPGCRACSDRARTSAASAGPSAAARNTRPRSASRSAAQGIGAGGGVTSSDPTAALQARTAAPKRDPRRRACRRAGTGFGGPSLYLYICPNVPVPRETPDATTPGPGESEAGCGTHR